MYGDNGLSFFTSLSVVMLGSSMEFTATGEELAVNLAPIRGGDGQGDVGGFRSS